jgi:PAS domain S-box-containing protein
MDTNKTKKQLINEMEQLRERIVALKSVRVEREQRFRAIFDQTYQFIGLMDLDGTLLEANRTARNFLGLEEEDVLGRPFWETAWWTHSPELQEKVRDAVARAGKGEFVRFEAYHPDPNGEIHTLDFSLRPVRDAAGDVVLLIPEGRDISERKRIEAELAASEKNYRNLVDNALVGIFKSSLEGEILYVNEAMAAMLAYESAEEMLLIPVVETYEDPGEREAFLAELREKGKVAGREIRLLTKTGTRKNVLISSVFEEGLISGMMMDITERKAMEEELRQNEERHRSLFEGSLDAVMLVDPESGRIVDANPAASDLLLLWSREMVGLHHEELYPFRLRRRASEGFSRIVNEQDMDHPEETIVLCSDGTEKPVEAMAHLIQIDGRLVVYLVFRDISEQKMSADALRQAAERYRRLFDDSPISLWEEDYSAVKTHIEKLRDRGVTDFRKYFEGHQEEVEQCAAMVRVVDVNEATLRMYEAESKEDFLEGLGRIFTEKSYEVFREGLIAIAEGKTSFEGEAVNRTLKGRSRDIQIRWTIPKDAERTLGRLLVSIIDVTERTRMEQELGNIQRLQALGVLAGGIAHDFNNILTAVLANISMARFYGALDEETSQMLADAEKASLRAKGLTQQLLTFAKGGEPIKKTVPMAPFLRDTVLFALSGSSARCEFSMPEGLWVIQADEGQLGQAVQNLVINADQAMPEGGVIRICAENVVVGERERGRLEPGRHVKVSVGDEGSGIPRDQIEKIFDPFFTTKERGRGLGLAIVFSVVQRHGGHVEVESSLGEGTVFHVYLPASGTSAGPTESSHKEPPGGEGRVLVVDDEEMVRKSAGEVLGRLGYETEFARDGTEGIELYTDAMRRRRPFDVVIMDLTIPGELGGKKALKVFKDLDPKAKVIVSSGYSDDPVMSRYREYGFHGVLVKPYNVGDLATEIQRVLLMKHQEN